MSQAEKELLYFTHSRQLIQICSFKKYNFIVTFFRAKSSVFTITFLLIDWEHLKTYALCIFLNIIIFWINRLPDDREILCSNRKCFSFSGIESFHQSSFHEKKIRRKLLFPIFWKQSHWKYFIEILYIEQRLNQMLEFCHLSPYSFQLNSFVRAWVCTLISRFPPNEKSSRKCVIFWTFHQSFRLFAIQFIRYSVSFCSIEETFCAWSIKVMCLVLLPTNLLHKYNANDGVSKWFHEMERA